MAKKTNNSDIIVNGKIGVNTENPLAFIHVVNPNDTETSIRLENTSASGTSGDPSFRLVSRSSDFSVISNDDFKGFIVLDYKNFEFPIVTNPNDCMSIYPTDLGFSFSQNLYKLDVGGNLRVTDLKIQTAIPTLPGRVWTATDSEGNGEWLPRSTYSDYSKTFTGTLSTTYTKLDMSGATLIGETEALFDSTNSRITGFNLGETGMASISMEIDSSSSTNHWVELQLRGYDSGGVELFRKRSSLRPLAKSVTNENLHKNLDFYFGPNVSYFEIYVQADAALTYTNPAVNVIKF